MIRKASDLINQYLREGKLAENRANPIGGGQYGVVFESDIPGNVIKQGVPGGYANDFVNEADLQSVAADMGFAPRVAGVERFAGGIGDRIEMQDVRGNFESIPAGNDGVFPDDPMFRVRTAQQLGQLALKGVRLEDRKADNMMRNKMTGRPMQLDFGIAGKFNNDSEKAAGLAHVTAEGFEAAGIPEMGQILRATVMDYLEGGDVAEGLDIAKQGFSRLQKITQTV